MNVKIAAIVGAVWVGGFVVPVAVAVPHECQPPEIEEVFSLKAIQDRLNDLVPQLRADRELVGLGAMIMIDGKVVASAIDGERKKGSGVQLALDDCWHIGSVTKSMTATMIARLVERGVIDWKSTVGACFGESIEMHADCRQITLEQLLTHRAGLPSNFPVATQFQHPPEGAERVIARKAAVVAVLAKKPGKPPGQSFQYSNVGFTVAAAMVEEKMKTSWEDLIRHEVFGPLGLNHAGFGPPRDEKTALDEPRGHRKFGPFKQAVGQEADNSPIMGPAGSIHLTLTELCVYGNEHLAGELGKGILLKQDTYVRLHTPKINSYAFGWVVPDQNKWIDGRLIWHNGSNTMWYTLLALLPDRNTVVAVTSNDGDIKNVEAAAFRIVEEYAKSQLSPPSKSVLRAGKILFLGNSITQHGPAPAIGWQGDWGMAASARENDFVHLVTNSLAEKRGIGPEVMVRNIAEFERQSASYDVNTNLKAALDFNADLVIVAIGENVPKLDSNESKTVFENSLRRLLGRFKVDNRTTLVVRSCFWPNRDKDKILEKVCLEIGGIFVNIGSLGEDESNYARSERQFDHDGVAAHPGDKGMKEIASAILDAVNKLP